MTDASPLVPWIGGKRRLAKHILPLFPQHTAYVEPFAGAAAIFFAKEPSKVEVLNDINGELVALYRVVQHHLDEFVRCFRWGLTSRRMFDWLKAQPPEPLTEIQRAARFFFLQRLAFGGKVSKQTFGVDSQHSRALNLLRLEEDLSAAHLRLANVVVENLDWKEVVRRYDKPTTLFFCDPPYWATEGYGVPFPLEEYEALAEVARTAKGQVIISVNDHPEMRRVFKGLPSRRLAIRYTVGQKTAKETGELIIGP